MVAREARIADSDLVGTDCVYPVCSHAVVSGARAVDLSGPGD